MIIGVLNQKGGVGKTTIAVNVAACLAMRSKRVLLVDADPQGSSLAWSAAREAPPLFSVVGMAKPTLHREMPEIARDYDVVVIDGAPRVNDLGRAAILASDTILIPVQPSPYDVWASVDIIKILKEARSLGANVKAAFVITRKIPNTVLGREVTEALSEHELPVLAAQIYQRQCYATTAGEGLTVIEMKPTEKSHREAAEEVRNLVEELVRFANG
jgi:chromosome partitioning protein